MDEKTGEILEDHWNPRPKHEKGRNFGVISDGNSKILLLKDAAGVLQLPSGPSNLTEASKRISASTGCSLGPDDFVPVWSLTAGNYLMGNKAVRVDKDTLGNRPADLRKQYPGVEWVSPTSASPNVTMLMDDATRKFLDVCGDKLEDLFQVQNACGCRECTHSGAPEGVIPEYFEEQGYATFGTLWEDLRGYFGEGSTHE